MRPFRLDRRTLLRGMAGVAIGLPWLEAMGTPRAHAASPAQRFVTVYQPGGTVLSKWRPTGSESSFQLSPILAPLAPVQNKLLVIDGLDMKSAVGEQHQAGIIAWLTGTTQSSTNRNYAGGPSVDQVIASRISRGKKAKPSIQMALRWATGKSHGLLSPMNAANYEDDAKASPIPPRLDPVEIWNDLFGTHADSSANAAARLARKKSVLDFLDRRYATLARKLGSGDRMKLEQHLEKIRELERSLEATGNMGDACEPPTLLDVSDYNPRTGLNSSDNGSTLDKSTDAAIPKVGQLMMDMLVMSLACDVTAVASLQWTDTEAKHTFPWLGLAEHHHYYQHDGGFKPDQCQQIGNWYSKQHLYLLQAMAAVDMGGHSLLDESVVFFGSELQEPPTHKKNDMPFLLAGNGGGLRTGRWLRYANLPHNDLLVSILNLFGDTRQSFGDPKYCTGPLNNLV